MAETKATRVTRAIWDRMLEAYRQRPSVNHIMIAVGVGRKMAKRAVVAGWPDLDLPPFVEVMSGAGTVYKELDKLRESWEDSGAGTREAARQAAEEAMAAKISMSSAMSVMKANQLMAAKLFEKINNGAIDLPDSVTPKLLFQLTKSMEAATQVVQRAMEIERKRLGEPEQVLGIQIGMMVDGLTDAELQHVYMTGEIPFRVLSQHPARVLEAAVEKVPEAPQLEAPQDNTPCWVADEEEGLPIGITTDADKLEDLPDPPAEGTHQ